MTAVHEYIMPPVDEQSLSACTVPSAVPTNGELTMWPVKMSPLGLLVSENRLFRPTRPSTTMVTRTPIDRSRFVDA